MTSTTAKAPKKTHRAPVAIRTVPAAEARGGAKKKNAV